MWLGWSGIRVAGLNFVKLMETVGGYVMSKKDIKNELCS